MFKNIMIHLVQGPKKMVFGSFGKNFVVYFEKAFGVKLQHGDVVSFFSPTKKCLSNIRP